MRRPREILLPRIKWKWCRHEGRRESNIGSASRYIFPKSPPSKRGVPSLRNIISFSQDNWPNSLFQVKLIVFGLVFHCYAFLSTNHFIESNGVWLVGGKLRGESADKKIRLWYILLETYLKVNTSAQQLTFTFKRKDSPRKRWKDRLVNESRSTFNCTVTSFVIVLQR